MMMISTSGTSRRNHRHHRGSSTFTPLSTSSKMHIEYILIYIVLAFSFLKDWINPESTFWVILAAAIINVAYLVHDISSEMKRIQRRAKVDFDRLRNGPCRMGWQSTSSSECCRYAASAAW